MWDSRWNSGVSHFLFLLEKVSTTVKQHQNTFWYARKSSNQPTYSLELLNWRFYWATLFNVTFGLLRRNHNWSIKMWQQLIDWNSMLIRLTVEFIYFSIGIFNSFRIYFDISKNNFLDMFLFFKYFIQEVAKQFDTNYLE